MSKSDKNRTTIPFINLVQHLDREEYMKILDSWTHFMMHVHEESGQDLISAYKERFGRQDYTYITYRRYWVWEFPGYRVWVHNEDGLSLEVNEGTSKEKARDYVLDHINKWSEDA